MGDEIHYRHFNKTDYQHFEKRLKEETRLLKNWFDSGRFASTSLMGGYELEAWLLDRDMRPSATNEPFLEAASSPLLSPELARFNIELNVEPDYFGADLLQNFERQLTQLWHHCQTTAAAQHNHFVGIGILPTLEDRDLSLQNISAMDRYRALNEQVLRHRHGKSIRLAITGEETLQIEHRDVMLEAAATSLQIHMQVPQPQAVRYYNASIILSAPLVAVSANSAFLFNHRLWHETRVPVFEQAVATGGPGGASDGPLRRVSFGNDYAHTSLYECFDENLQHYPVLLPVEYRAPLARLRHLRLHNGTIWRWNRPLIGFDSDGTPHLRIEQRVMAAAPSIIDNIANIAFYYGLVHHYAERETPAEQQIEFAAAKDNFYRAARHGLAPRLHWPDRKSGKLRPVRLQKLILEQLLGEAENGLQRLGIDGHSIEKYLSIIEKRTASNQTGSVWQQRFANMHQRDMTAMMQCYLRHQKSGYPVHEWDYNTIKT